jgi:hypothetical protein
MVKRVLLAYMPFGGIDRPALGLSLLKASAENIGFPCDVSYFNLKFAELIGFDGAAQKIGAISEHLVSATREVSILSSLSDASV